MTLLVVSVSADTLDEVKSRAERAWAGGAQAVEVRIDTFEDDPGELAAYINTRRDRTWIVTCRGSDEGGRFRGDTMERLSRLIAAARGTDAYVDFEAADWRRSPNIRQKVLLASAASDGSGHRLILSAHHRTGLPDDLAGAVRELSATPQTVCAKVAYNPGHICDTFEALDVLHRCRASSPTVIAMGEEGLWTRVLARKLGAFASYCALDAASATAPGQLSFNEMIDRYRWPSIDESTRVYGVIGDPVAHSMSPLVFNRWFAEAGINAVYLPLRVARDEGCLRRFLDGCRERDWLDVGGFSVTVPHKTAALHWVGSGADATAGLIGALNTLVFRKGDVTGCNTDCDAAVSSLVDALGCSRGDLAGVPVDVLGSGGAAQAVVYGLYGLGCKVTVYGRSPDRTLRLADKHGAAAAAWGDRVQRDGQVLVNCTTVGMWPNVDASPMPAEALVGCRLVFDLVYNPLETRLLKDAARLGVRTLNGLDMFIRQAGAQFTSWTAAPPDTQHVRRLIERAINRRVSGNVPRCIALIGMRGAGKSVVGRELAALLGGEAVDTDEDVVAAAGKPITTVFTEEGESGFRRREHEAITRAVAVPPAVISVGGGAVLDEFNVQALKRAATLVWLTAPVEELWRRVAVDPATATCRPPLTREAGLDEIRRLNAERSPVYQRVAELVINTAGRTPREVAKDIAAACRLER